MKNYQVSVTVDIPGVEAEDLDDAINFVTEVIEESFVQRVQFRNQTATTYDE